MSTNNHEGYTVSSQHISSFTLMNTLTNIPLLIGLKVMMDKNMNIPLNDEHLSSYINKISVYL